ncbi:MAG: hypothetical protein E4G94_03195, partial [ANME-2 cluster archaeon]
MVTADSYHGKECKLLVQTTGTTEMINNTSTAINAKGFEVTLNYTIDELFGQDSILRQDVVKTAVNCPVKISYVKNDGLLLATIMVTPVADDDVDGNTDAGRSRGVITDTPGMTLFNLWGYAISGSNTFIVKATNIAFTSVPVFVA